MRLSMIQNRFQFDLPARDNMMMVVMVDDDDDR
jgi:hypothetical protein